jgi:hypothetical protein
MLLDSYGERLSPKDVDHHHVFARSTAKGKGAKVREFINQEGLLVPIVRDVHTELHRRLEFPLLPTVSLIHRVNMAIQDLRYENPYDRFIAITETFERFGDKCVNSDHREQSARIADNLQRQAEFILLGQVQVIESEEYND